MCKNGKVRGKQCYKCKACGYNFIVGDEREQGSPEGKALAALLYGTGKGSYGFIANLFNVTRPAVQQWIRKFASRLPEPHPVHDIQEFQIDEMSHFIDQKKIWIWPALDCTTNKTIGWLIGDRSAKTLKKFYEKKLKHLSAHFYTDDWVLLKFPQIQDHLFNLLTKKTGRSKMQEFELNL